MSDPERERQLQKVLARPEPASLEQFDALWQIFERAPRRIVTQHVVAEAFTNRMRRHSNWSRAIGLLPNRVEERGCSIADPYAGGAFRRIIGEIGPTDAGLIYTAEIEKATIIFGRRPAAALGGGARCPCAVPQSVGLPPASVV